MKRSTIRTGGASRGAAIGLLAAAVLLAAPGCSQKLAPQITALSANPTCDALILNQGVGQVDVTFFARATGGNIKSKPVDGVNAPLDMDWDFGDGQTAQNASLITHAYTAPGTYTATLTVKDSDGDSDTRSIDVTVLSEAQALVPVATQGSVTPVLDANSAIIGYNTRFTGSATVGCPWSPLEIQIQYLWDFGDGSPVLAGQSVPHRYPATGGPYTVTMTAALLNTTLEQQTQITTTGLP